MDIRQNLSALSFTNAPKYFYRIVCLHKALARLSRASQKIQDTQLCGSSIIRSPKTFLSSFILDKLINGAPTEPSLVKYITFAIRKPEMSVRINKRQAQGL